MNTTEKEDCAGNWHLAFVLSASSWKFTGGLKFKVWTAFKEDSFQVVTTQSDCCVTELTDIMYKQYGCGGEACISSIDDLDDIYFKMQCSKDFFAQHTLCD